MRPRRPRIRTSTRTRPRSSGPRTGAGAAAPRSGAPCTRCSRPSTSPPATGSRPPRRAQALAEGVPEREAEIRDARRERVAGADRARPRSSAGHAWWREVPVAAIVDGVLVEGFIDLLVDTPDGLVVVDYKTDQVAVRRGARRRGGALRGAGRARTPLRSRPRSAARWRGACSCSRATAGAVEREVADLPAAAAGVRALLPAFAGLD